MKTLQMPEVSGNPYSCISYIEYNATPLMGEKTAVIIQLKNPYAQVLAVLPEGGTVISYQEPITDQMKWTFQIQWQKKLPDQQLTILALHEADTADQPVQFTVGFDITLH